MQPDRYSTRTTTTVEQKRAFKYQFYVMQRQLNAWTGLGVEAEARALGSALGGNVVPETYYLRGGNLIL